MSFPRGLAVALTLLAPAALAAQIGTSSPGGSQWQIDPTHSELSFRITHMMVSRVQGTFRDWSGSIVGDTTDWSAGAVEITIQTASVDTKNDRRDADLRSARFFDVATFPTITFRSTAIERHGVDIRVQGDLTIRGVTKPVVLEGRYLGFLPGRRPRVGFEASTTINRMDFGVSYNRALEAGGVLLGDDVTIELTVAAVRGE